MNAWTVDYDSRFTDGLSDKDKQVAIMNRKSINDMLIKHGLDVLRMAGGGIEFYKRGKDLIALRNGFEYLIKVNTRDKQSGSFTFTKTTLIT
ncbi:MAG: hypothetical protein LBD23_20605 [Oscillospiraceae bacterium]|jgi:hypothetical protein|nr:hypothetical protein [Oscillospiraceae bacterium]